MGHGDTIKKGNIASQQDCTKSILIQWVLGTPLNKKMSSHRKYHCIPVGLRKIYLDSMDLEDTIK